MQECKNPTGITQWGFQFWRRPTLARPVAVLPSGLQRFTSVFGMGTGGAAALGSPEIWPAAAGQISGELKISDCRLQICLSAKSTTNFQRTFRSQIFNLKSAIFNCWFSDIYIQEFISAEHSRRYNFRLRFSLGSFALLCWPSLAYASEGLTEK